MTRTDLGPRLATAQRLSVWHWLALWLAGLYLRLTLLVAPPLAPFISAEMGLTATAGGALTTLPVLMLALAAIAGAWVIARAGARRTIVLCLILIGLTSAARGLAPGLGGLLLATALMGIGIAALQPALPALVQQWAPQRIALATAVYMNGMLMGEVFSAGFTLPVVMPLVDDNWRWALLVWSAPALLVAWLVGTRQTPSARSAAHGTARPAEPRRWVPDFRDPLVWYLGLMLGCSASLFFGINAYMAVILAQRGEPELLATGLMLFNTAQVVASVLALRYAGRWLGRATPMLGLLALSLVATVVFGVWSGLPALVAAFLVSLFTGVLLILMVSLPGAMVTENHTAPLAAGMFTLGYALSFLVPLLSGLLVDATGVAELALLPLLLLGLVCLPIGRRIANRYRQVPGR